MILCDFCKHGNTCYPKYVSMDDYCYFDADEDKIVDYAKSNNMSVSDVIALIKFCCKV